MRIAGLIIFICTFSRLVAQSYQITFYDQEKGLPNEMVKAVAVDEQGFLWLGTDNGLFRFDGIEFNDFSGRFGFSYVKGIHQHSGGNLLVTYDMGFVKILSDIAGAAAVEIAKGGAGVEEAALWYPKTMFEDSDGSVWLSDNTKVYRYSNGVLTSFDLNITTIPASYSRSFSFFQCEPEHLCMVSQPGDFYRFSKNDKKIIPMQANFRLTNVSAAAGISHDMILIGCDQGLAEVSIHANGSVTLDRILNPGIDASSILKISENEFLIGTWSNGLWKLRLHNGMVQTQRIHEFTITSGINDMILHNNTIILATDMGFAVMKPRLFSRMEFETPGSFVHHLSYDASNESIYISVGNRLIRTNPSAEIFETVHTTQNSNILHVIPDDATLWISDNQGFIKQISGNKLLKTYDLRTYGSSIHRFIKDPVGNLWICQSGLQGVLRIDPQGNFRVFNTADGLPEDINIVALSPLLEVLLCTGDTVNYLYRFEPQKDRFINISKPPGFRSGNQNITINDIAFDYDKGIWLASNHGLLQLEKNSLTRINLGRLTNEDIKAITIDKYSNLWFALSDGICRFNSKELLIFNHLDGLPSKTISYRCLLALPDDRILAGTLAGVGFMQSRIAPAATPTPMLLSVSNKGIPLATRRQARFHNDSYLAFNFFTADYPSEGISYQYQLIYGESMVEDNSVKRSFSTGEFSPGQYKLVVKARQRGNYLWSEPLIIPFTIYRVWYQSFWFWGIFSIVLFVVTYSLIRWKNRRLVADKIRLNLQVRERTFELEAKNREIEAKNQLLIKATEEAQQSAKVKTEFLSMMSHEILTPMHGVIFSIDILQKENDSPKLEDHISTLKSSAENMMALLNDILDFNKIEAGRIELKPEDFDLKETIRKVLSGFYKSASQKNISLEFYWDTGIPNFLSGDATRIRQVMANLVGNAIKFTESGYVKVSVENQQQNDSGITLKISVKDSGIGIPAEKLDDIFDAFRQASSDTTRRYGGTGLGLAISKKLLELMQSKIAVESTEGKGSVFSFEITFKQAGTQPDHDLKSINKVQKNNGLAKINLSEPQKSGADNEKPQQTKPLEGLRLLMVEDNLVNIKVASFMIKSWGVDIDVVTDGIEAVEKYIPGNYDLILMDLHLPGKDGLEVTREIRKKDQNVPIIALTAAVLDEEKDKAFAAGMNEFISKPFQSEDLFSKILLFLRRQD